MIIVTIVIIIMDSLYTDIILVFFDDTDYKIHLKIDKQVLIDHSDYFKSMFNGIYLENVQDMIVIGVPDARITHGIFNLLTVSIYPLTDSLINPSTCREICPLSRHCNKSNESIELLREYICRNFFMMKIDIDADLTVPYDKFHKLLSMIDIIGFTDETIKLLTNNIPPDFDLEYFPTDVLLVLKDNLCGSAIILSKYNRVEIVNLANKKVIRKLDFQKSNLSQDSHFYPAYYCYLCDGLIAIRDGQAIYIYDYVLHKINVKIPNDQFSPNYLNRIVYLSNRKLITIGCLNGCLKFYDIDSGNLITVLNVLEEIELSSLCISSDQKYMAIYDNSNGILLLDLEKSTIGLTDIDEFGISFFKCGKNITDTYSSANSNYLYVCVNHYKIYKLDLSTGWINYISPDVGGGINCQKISPNNEYLVVCTNNQVSVHETKHINRIWTIETEYCAYAVEFITNDTIIIAGTGEYMEIWNIPTTELVDKIPINGTVYHVSVIPSYQQHMIDRINNIIGLKN